MKARAFTAAALVAAALSVSAAPALAADEPSVSWAVSPSDGDGPDGRSWVESRIDPGETVTEHLAVRNLGETPITFALVAADGYFTETGRFNMLQAGEESVDAGTWITVEESVTVASGETRVVPFTIAVPVNATPGDHPAGIAASISTTGTTEDGAQVGVDSRVGFRVMTRVTGELAPAIALEDLAAAYTPSWNLFTPGELTVSYAAENSGNTQLAFGEGIYETTTPRGDLYPGDIRVVTVAPIKVWPLGPVTLEVTLESTVPSDDGLAVKPVTRSVTVWAVPWLHLAVLLGVIATIVLVVLARRRSSAKLDRLLEEARAEGRSQVISS